MCSSDLIEQKIADVTKLMANVESDEDFKRKANRDIKEIGQSLDEMEKSKEMPQLKGDFRENIENIKEMIIEIGLEENKNSNLDELERLEDQGEKAIVDNNRVILGQTVDQLIQLYAKIFWASPQAFVYYFNELINGQYSFSSKEDADYYFEKGNKAIESGDIDSLKASVTGLNSLISSETSDSISNKISGIMR